MRHLRRLLVPGMLVLTLAASACSRFRLQEERAPGIDFSRLATFAWMPADVAPVGDQYMLDRYMERRVRETVEGALRDKGYRPAEVGGADLLLTYRLTTDGRYVGGLPIGYYGYGIEWWAERQGHARDSYEEGTLIVDAVDRAANRLAWRGSASARLLPHYDFDQRAARVTDAVESIMEGFPRH